MKALAFTLLASCWSGTNTTTIREVPVARYIHDVPRECKDLPVFPSVATLGHHTYVREINRWIRASGDCLNVATYPVDQLLEERQW